MLLISKKGVHLKAIYTKSPLVINKYQKMGYLTGLHTIAEEQVILYFVQLKTYEPLLYQYIIRNNRPIQIPRCFVKQSN
jgi:hypothetical protein